MPPWRRADGPRRHHRVAGGSRDRPRALSDLHVVSTMHERKALMSELSDAFVMLPGGFGTYEEFMESVTWAQLGIHDKRCGILNVDGFFDDLLAFLRHAVDQGFIRARQVRRRWWSPTTSTTCSTASWRPTIRSRPVDAVEAGRPGGHGNHVDLSMAHAPLPGDASAQAAGEEQHVAELVASRPSRPTALGHRGVRLLGAGGLLQERRRVAEASRSSRGSPPPSCPTRGAASRP